MQDRVYEILFNSDDYSWQGMLYNLVRLEQMDPWDVDITNLAAKFLENLKTLKEMDFKVSGKMVLAAAILLKLKSHKLVTDDLTQLDRLIAMSGETEDEFYDELLSDEEGSYHHGSVDLKDRRVTLVPRTPQPRKRKVSVYDLVEALEKALVVKNRRRVLRDEAPEVHIPTNHRDIDEMIVGVYDEIRTYFMEKKEAKIIKFSQLLKSDEKEEKIYTFYPLLHLSNQRHVDLHQEEAFSDFDIALLESDNPLIAEEKEVTEEVFAQVKKKKSSPAQK